jgi:hypothetical protein
LRTGIDRALEKVNAVTSVSISKEQIRLQILDMEQREADAMLRADVAALDSIWHDEFVANSSSNLVAGKKILLEVIGDGRLRLRSHKRRVVRIATQGDVVVATGNENSEMVGFDAVLFCSYMNVWVQEAGTWRMLGRHVGLIDRLTPKRQSSPEV